MAEKTSEGKSVSTYLKEQLAEARKAQQAALTAGYPSESALTQAYYAGIPSLYTYGDPEQAQALGRISDVYEGYGEAGGYDKTGYGDIADLYRRAGVYDKTGYGDIADLYRKAGIYDQTQFSDFESKYGAAGQYAPTSYADIEAQAAARASFDPSQFSRSDYTTKNIQERMSPYEELVAGRQKARLEKAYQEGRGQRELEAIRSGTFGGSGSAVREELSRRDYLDRLADLEAQSLQSSYESAVGLYGKEFADRMAAEQAEEQSRQFAQQAGVQGVESILAARQAEEASRQFGKGAEFQGLEGAVDARQRQAAQVAAAKEAELAGIAGIMGTREQEAAQTAAAKEAEIAGISGLMDTRQQEAAQTAAAKEAELAGLAGQESAAVRQAAMAEQEKNMQLANLAALQGGGQQQEAYNLAKTQYPLDVATAGANILGAVQGATSPLPTQKPSQPSTMQNILAGATAVGGVLQGVGSFFRDGGLVQYYPQYYYRGGGLADLEPQYYDSYER
jgi:hypothetical protein